MLGTVAYLKNTYYRNKILNSIGATNLSYETKSSTLYKEGINERYCEQLQTI